VTPLRVRNHLELIIHVIQMPSSKSMPEALQTLITGQVGVAVALLTCIQEEPGLSLDSAELFHGFSHSLQVNGGMVTRLRHDHFLQNSFQFITQHHPII
jgi:hypothetical protein